MTTGQQSTAGRLSLPSDPGVTRVILETEDGVVRRTLLPGGLRVITEQMPGVRSSSIGVWVNAGSVDETEAEHGCSHFLEHLLFKGTPERSAMDISAAMDAIGGEFNAFTAKEFTVYHARVLDSDLELVIDVLGDMLTSSLITAADVEAERNVILDEIAMHDDDPDDVVHNLWAEQAWGSGPLGRPIAGTAESIGQMSRDRIVDFYQQRYRPGDLVVSVAGSLDHEAVVAQVATAFARNGFLSGQDQPRLRSGSLVPHPIESGEIRLARSFEQANLVLGFNGLTRQDPGRYALSALSAVLGGGTSSRLFQEVREARGLAYSVYSFESHYVAAGMVGIAAGCLPDRVDAVLATVYDELAKLAGNGVTEVELARARGQLRAGLVLGLEDSGARMSRLGKAELIYDELPSIDELIARTQQVTSTEMHTLAAELYRGPGLLALVHP